MTTIKARLASDTEANDANDKYTTLVVITIERSGVTGDAWLEVGVPLPDIGSYEASNHGQGYLSAWPMDGAGRAWLEDGIWSTLTAEYEDSDIVRACQPLALAIHRARLAYDDAAGKWEPYPHDEDDNEENADAVNAEQEAESAYEAMVQGDWFTAAEHASAASEYENKYRVGSPTWGQFAKLVEGIKENLIA